ncbi:MFS general substrate transporter [Ganoderma sinense ZZ0214-1]|uniref:MFS general substrate transporter n=1 Tax=Ganoderma sinense ZZ0214-1 TaxID=1077348 RepID=A0A2G8S166_9APHY|nr:MFS general substrate transporter [Ganoderma sinense ZZ0214-1]
MASVLPSPMLGAFEQPVIHPPALSMTPDDETTMSEAPDPSNLSTRSSMDMGSEAEKATSAPVDDAEKQELRTVEFEKPLSNREIQLVFFALSVAAFLGSLDQTIISTAMPTIASQYNALPQQSWISLAYLLTSTVFQPIFGRGTDLYGSRLMLFLSIAFFDVGSLFCAVATDFIWFCSGRAIAGIGAAGLLVVCMIIISQMVPLRDRGKFVGAMYARTAIATVLGPVLGGIFTRFNWRWCFWINLILSGPAVAILLLFIKKIPNKKRPGVSFKDVDFGGIILIAVCVVALCLALSWGGTTFAWNSPVIITLLVVGSVLIPVYILYEMYVPRFPVIPLDMFRIRNVVASTGNYFFSSVSMYGLSAYIPSYYQLVRGDNQLVSGLEILPYVGTIVIFSTVVGYLMSWTGRTRPWMWAGGVVNTIANGLLIMLDGTLPRAVEYVFLALSGAGVGFIAQTNTVSAQSKVAKELLASVTTMTMWSKSLGGIVGIAMQGSIISNVFQKNMFADPAAAPYVDQLKALSDLRSLPPDIQELASRSYGKAFSTMMIATTPFVAVGLLFSLTAEPADLDRKSGAEKPEEDEVAPKAGDTGSQTGNGDLAIVSEKPADAI